MSTAAAPASTHRRDAAPPPSAPAEVPPALAAATARDAAARVPFEVDGCIVGSVARRHLTLLARLGGSLLTVDDRGVVLRAASSPARDAALHRLHRELRDAGAIAAWRDETIVLPDPATWRPLATIERAAARFWGTLTSGVHLNGYVADDRGRPTRLWIARRSPTKATDPGLFDNLVGGGVGAGQTPLQALVREAGEEAGLAPSQLATVRAGSVLRLHRDIAEGLQHEWLHGHDLRVAPGWSPANADGEVAGFACRPVDEAVALACGSADVAPMTVDSALVTIDFALRHGLFADAAAHTVVDAAVEKLRVTRWTEARRRRSDSVRPGHD